MSTGLFSHRTTGPGRNYLNARRAMARRRLTAFAEGLAETGNVTHAAIGAGVSQQRGSKMLQQLRRELGWQAC